MKLLVFLSSILLFIGCNQQIQRPYENATEVAKNSIIDKSMEHPGKKLLETKCYLCHSPSDTIERRLAPPMIAVKRHYLTDEITKDEFVSNILNWVMEPQKEKSRMPGAVKRFGIMPTQEFSEEDIVQIADYMFFNEIDQPSWFEDHYRKGHGKGKHMN